MTSPADPTEAIRAALERAVWLYENSGLIAGRIAGQPMAPGRWINDARSALAQPPSVPSAEPAAVVYPPDGTVSPFTVINLGTGRVQMGDSIHDGRLPALWFGKNGQGMGHEEVMNRQAHEGETLAVVTFANVEGLDVLLDVIQRIRRVSFPGAAPQQTAPQAAPVAARSKALADMHADCAKRMGAFYRAYGMAPPALAAPTAQPLTEARINREAPAKLEAAHWFRLGVRFAERAHDITATPAPTPEAP